MTPRRSDGTVPGEGQVAGLVHRPHIPRVTGAMRVLPLAATFEVRSTPNLTPSSLPGSSGRRIVPRKVLLMSVENTTVPGDDPERDPTLRKLQNLGRTVSSADEDIRGRMVKDKDGQDVGTIDDLLVDAAAQKVRFMEVASGGFLGLGETKSLIPVEAITRITEHDVYIGHTREHVAGAPPYDPELVKEDAGYFFGLYPYYGYQGGVVPVLMGYPYAKRDESSVEVGWPHHA